MKLLKLFFLSLSFSMAFFYSTNAYACDEDYCMCEDCEYDFECNEEYNCGCLYYEYVPEPRRDAHNEDSIHLEVYNKAMQGDKDALFRLGQIYFDPIDVTQDWPLALDYFIRAAELGHVEAMFEVGNLYRAGRGTGTGQNFGKALFWHGKAADHGHQEALISMIRIYSTYYEDNDDIIFELEHRLAALKNPLGYYWLGVAYHLGTGTEVDNEKAFKYTEMAVKNKLEESYFFMGFLYENGYGTKQNYRKAIRWYEESIEKHSITYDTTLLQLAKIYEDGRGVKQNYEKAFEYYSQFRYWHSDPNGRYKYAYFLIHGLGTEKHYKDGMSIMRDLARSGYLDAQYEYAVNLLKEYEENKNSKTLDEALTWLEKPADKEYKEAVELLKKYK